MKKQEVNIELTGLVSLSFTEEGKGIYTISTSPSNILKALKEWAENNTNNSVVYEK